MKQLILMMGALIVLGGLGLPPQAYAFTGASSNSTMTLAPTPKSNSAPINQGKVTVSPSGQSAKVQFNNVNLSVKPGKVTVSPSGQLKGISKVIGANNLNLSIRPDRIMLPSEGQLRSIGNGFNVNSAGDIFKDRKIVARLDAAGNIIGDGNKALSGAMQSELKGLFNRMKLPIGKGRTELSNPRITQKNLYVGGPRKLGIDGGGGISVDISTKAIVGAVIKAATSPDDTAKTVAPKGDYVLAATGEIKSPDGQVLGAYDAARNQFFDPQGHIITDGPTHSVLYAVVARSQANAAPSI